MSRKKQRNHADKPAPKMRATDALDDAPDFEQECEVCGAKPVVRATGMCGPCTFGDSSTAGGNW